MQAKAKFVTRVQRVYKDSPISEYVIDWTETLVTLIVLPFKSISSPGQTPLDRYPLPSSSSLLYGGGILINSWITPCLQWGTHQQHTTLHVIPLSQWVKISIFLERFRWMGLDHRNKRLSSIRSNMLCRGLIPLSRLRFMDNRLAGNCVYKSKIL